MGRFRGGIYNGQRRRNRGPHGFGTFEIRDQQGNKTYYEGWWQDGVEHGNGLITFSSGRSFDGTFREGRVIRGTLTDHNGRKMFHGTFNRDWTYKNGKLYYADGRKYIGDFLNNLPHGQGFLRFPNGDSFTGSFKEGVRDGMGLYTKKVLGVWHNDRNERVSLLNNAQANADELDILRDSMLDMALALDTSQNRCDELKQIALNNGADLTELNAVMEN